MTSIDVDKLVKVLQLTDSPNEGESFNAMKMANKLLQRYGLRWSDVIRLKHTTAVSRQEVAPGPEYRDPVWPSASRQYAGYEQAMTPKQAAAYSQSQVNQQYRDWQQYGQQSPFFSGLGGLGGLF